MTGRVVAGTKRARQLAGAKMGNKSGAGYPHSSTRQQQREARKHAARLAKEKVPS